MTALCRIAILWACAVGVMGTAIGQDSPVAATVDSNTFLTLSDGPCGCQRCQCVADMADSEEAEGLFNKIPFLLERDIKINGLIIHGYTENGADPTNPPPPGSGNWPGQGFPYRADQYMFNRVMMIVDKETDTGGCGWDIGGHVDALYGTDYFALQSRGLEAERDNTNKWNRDTGTGLVGRQLHGLALPRLYLDVAHNNTKVRMGKFLHPMGYERFDPTFNQLGYSNTYTLFYGEFRPVTGLMTDVKVSDQLTLLGGFHRGNGNWEDNNNHLNGFGGFEWTSCDKSTSLNFVFDIGAEDDAGENDQYKHSIVFQKTWSDQVTYIFHHHYGDVQNNVATLDFTEQPGTWNSFVQYLLYQFNEKSGVGLRYEIFDDQDGTRVSPRAGFPGAAPGNYQQIGGSVLYKPADCLWLRVGVRWDWFDADNSVAAPGPWDDGTSRSQFTSSFSAVHLF